MLLSDHLGLCDELEENGVFDPLLEGDSPFFINLQRLKKTSVPEFVNSYVKIRSYFLKIIKLLDKAANKDRTDVFFRQALRMFNFSEVNGICLGYAKGISGAGFGAGLGGQVISTAYDIVKAGVHDPEFFELLPLFQENVGADRLSDMIATLILDDIRTYTKRINVELGIIQVHYKNLLFNKEFLINPYKNEDVLLVPVDILHKLPVAETWEDIDIVVAQNSTLRAEMNKEVAEEWHNYSAYERKSYLRQNVFKVPDTCKRILDVYKGEELEEFYPTSEFTYFLSKLTQKIERLNIDYTAKHKVLDSFNVSIEIMDHFKNWVENNKGWETIWSVDSRKREKVLQRVIHGQAQAYIKANGLSMSCEPDEGRGPVDFKVSLGTDITLIEVKLSSNNQYLHGYKVQIEEYGRAEGTDKLIYVIVDLGHPLKIKKLQENHDKRYNDGGNPPTLIVIDGKKKISASKV